MVRTRLIHLIRNTFRYASWEYWGQIAADLKPIFTAASSEATWRAFEEFKEWAKSYPAISKLWRGGWKQFVSLTRGPRRRDPPGVLCSKNATESLNARYLCAASVRRHVPSEQHGSTSTTTSGPTQPSGRPHPSPGWTTWWWWASHQETRVPRFDGRFETHPLLQEPDE